MDVETALDLISALGWRLHTLTSYPGAVHGKLFWGASIRITSFIYGHSFNQPTAARALEIAIDDGQEKISREQSERFHKPRSATRTLPSLDSIFGKDPQ